MSVVQAGRAVLVDGEVFLDNWNPTERGEAFYGMGSKELTDTIDLSAGTLRLCRRGDPGGARARWLPEAALIARAVFFDERGKRVPAVYVSGPSVGGKPRRGTDRDSMTMPGEQDELVRAVAAANPRTIVIVNAASPVAMPWADDVAAILQCWFAGEEWGNALADVLSGDVSPSGKLPTTFPVRIEDTPAFVNYPGEQGKVFYGERVFVGYRSYDAQDRPAVAFGHGLSYTTFEFGEVAWTQPATPRRCASTCP
jgi:beta-glucosidase